MANYVANFQALLIKCLLEHWHVNWMPDIQGSLLSEGNILNSQHCNREWFMVSQTVYNKSTYSDFRLLAGFVQMLSYYDLFCKILFISFTKVLFCDPHSIINICSQKIMLTVHFCNLSKEKKKFSDRKFRVMKHSCFNCLQTVFRLGSNIYFFSFAQLRVVWFCYLRDGIFNTFLLYKGCGTSCPFPGSQGGGATSKIGACHQGYSCLPAPSGSCSWYTEWGK